MRLSIFWQVPQFVIIGKFFDNIEALNVELSFLGVSEVLATISGVFLAMSPCDIQLAGLEFFYTQAPGSHYPVLWRAYSCLRLDEECLRGSELAHDRSWYESINRLRLTLAQAIG